MERKNRYYFWRKECAEKILVRIWVRPALRCSTLPFTEDLLLFIFHYLFFAVVSKTTIVGVLTALFSYIYLFGVTEYNVGYVYKITAE